jgi:formate dehydrogenase subunit delta
VAEHLTYTASGPVLRMADEIAVQFDRRPIAEAATEIAAHIRTFWDPRMRAALLDAIEVGADIAPVVRAAAALLRLPG